MPVSGVVISCQPEMSAVVEAAINELVQIEIHSRLDNGKLIAVLETEAVNDEVEIVTALMQINGVVDVRLAYHNFEDLVELQN